LKPSNVSDLGVLWTANTGDEIVSSPAVVDGRVYVASQDGNLYAFKAKNGKPLWTQIVGGRVISSPAVAGRKVFIGSFITNNNSTLWVFDAVSGSVVWQQSIFNGPIFASPVTAHGAVYIGGDDDRERAFKAKTGMDLWSQVVGFSLTSSAAVANGKVYVGADNVSLNTNFSAFKASDGTLVWSVPTPGGHVSYSAAIDDRMVFIGSDGGTFNALDAGTGALVWSQQTGGPIGLSSPAVAYDIVYIGSEDGRLYAFRENDGFPLWSRQTGGPIDSSPAVANGVVYVGSGDGKVYAFRAKDGVPLWSHATGGPVLSSPAVVNGVVYVGSSDHKLYAFGLRHP
jgi:outer membrane protein assembly factor BamB